MLTGNQLAEWEAFDSLEPVGSYKHDFRLAKLENLIYVLACASNGKKVDSKVKDFMPWWFTQYLDGDVSVSGGGQSMDDMKRNLLQWARQHNRMISKKAQKVKREK
jgi:hypothetical protein